MDSPQLTCSAYIRAPPAMTPSTNMEAEIVATAAYAGTQLQHHSEKVFQAGIAIELQGRGFFVQTEVALAVPFVPSWSDSPVTVGSVRLDCVVRKNDRVVVLELKRRSGGSHESQLEKYKALIPQAWGLALVTPQNVEWLRRAQPDVAH